MRRAGIVIAVVAGVIAAIVAAIAVVLSLPRRASDQWAEFSIGPASGESVHRQTAAVRADGITLKYAIATAYEFPAVRIVGPSWLSETRYSITASVGADAAGSFPSLLREELKHRLQLETHVEQRPFDVFILRATDAPRVPRAAGNVEQGIIGKRRLEMRAMSMSGLASLLQNVLSRPVINETDLTGAYDIEFEFREDRVESVTAVLRDRFGLRLSRETRNMDALIVDRIRRDPALVLFEHVGRLTGWAPRAVREGIAHALTIH